MKTKESLSITIPAYNEEETLVSVCQQALREVAKLTNNYELLLVNDGSVDSTGKLMDELKKKYGGKVRVIHHRKNRGFSGAMKTCYQNARKELIFLAPADGQFNFSELKKFVKAIEGKDVAVAYRLSNPEPFYRKFNSFFFHFFCRILFGIKFKESSSFILYRKKVRDAIKIESEPFSALFLVEFLHKSIKKGYRFVEVPVHFYKRKGGRSKGGNPKMIIKTFQEMFRFWRKIKSGKISKAWRIK